MAIGTPDDERPLLDWVLARYPDTPRTRAKEWIVAGRVSVDGVVIRKPHQVMPEPKDGLELLGREAVALACGSGWQIHPRVELLYLDTAVAVVNKGPGIISVPAPGCDLSALSVLVDFLSGKLRTSAKSRTKVPQVFQKLRPLPVHRLDQYTSGIFCMAMNPEARAILIEQLKVHQIQREYLAFAEGRAKESRGTWRNWVQLSEDELVQRIVAEPNFEEGGESKAQEAVTHFEVLAEYELAGGRGFVTKLRLKLETGRKHQIRVQAAHAGLPLVGDRLYHPKYREPGRGAVPIEFSRQALHAERLSLEHPQRGGKRMSWRAEVPKDLRELEKRMKEEL
jgi:23S rRNA pseudouridine1911/1915/1917 synthase